MRQGFTLKSRLRFIHHNGGQAVIEYLLLLTVTLSIIYGVAKSFQSTKKFINSYVGDYFSCLMEYGELPSLGSDNADLTKHKNDGRICDYKYQKFSFIEGRPPQLSSSSSGSNSSKDTANDRDGKSAQNSRNSEKNSSDSAGGSVDKNGSTRAGRDPYSSGAISRSSSPGTADGASLAGSGKVRTLSQEEEGEDAASSRGRVSSSRSGYNSRNSYRAITGRMADEIQKNQRNSNKRNPSSRMVAKNNDEDENMRRGPRVAKFNPPEKREIASVEDKEESLGFGGLVKWLIIIGMIVALVVFFGGQILNYSKSDNS